VVVHKRSQTRKKGIPAVVVLGAVDVGAATAGRILVIIGGCVVPLGRRHLGRLGGLVRGRRRGRQFRHLVLDRASLSLVAMPDGAREQGARRPAPLSAGQRRAGRLDVGSCLGDVARALATKGAANKEVIKDSLADDEGDELLVLGVDATEAALDDVDARKAGLTGTADVAGSADGKRDAVNAADGATVPAAGNDLDVVFRKAAKGGPALTAFSLLMTSWATARARTTGFIEASTSSCIRRVRWASVLVVEGVVAAAGRAAGRRLEGGCSAWTRGRSPVLSAGPRVATCSQRGGAPAGWPSGKPPPPRRAR